MEERRQLERFDLKLPAKLQVIPELTDGPNGILNLVTQNVCAGGAFFSTPTPLPKGTKVKLDLLLERERLKVPSERRAKINLTGAVLRSQTNGMAIGFDSHYRMTPLPSM
jgi:hypothetical protein